MGLQWACERDKAASREHGCSQRPLSDKGELPGGGFWRASQTHSLGACSLFQTDFLSALCRCRPKAVCITGLKSPWSCTPGLPGGCHIWGAGESPAEEASFLWLP